MKSIIFYKSFIYFNNYVRKFIDDKNIDSDSLLFFDFDFKEDLDKFQNEFFTQSLISNNKLLIIKNARELLNDNPTESFKKFINNIKNIKNNNYLFFIFNSDTLNKGYYLKINNLNVIEIKIPFKKNLNLLVADFFKKNNIEYDYQAINFITSNFANNFDQLLNELYKYKFINKKLTLNLLKDITFKFDNIFFFKFLNDFILKDYLQIIQNIKYLKKHAISPIFFLEQLILEISLILQLKIGKNQFLKNEYLSNNELNIHNYRLDKMEKYGNRFTYLELLNLFNNFFHLIIKMKLNNKVNHYLILEAKLLIM